MWSYLLLDKQISSLIVRVINTKTHLRGQIHFQSSILHLVLRLRGGALDDDAESSGDDANDKVHIDTSRPSQ